MVEGGGVEECEIFGGQKWVGDCPSYLQPETACLFHNLRQYKVGRVGQGWILQWGEV